MAREFERLLS